MSTANDCKEAGNKALSAEKFKEAVEHYSAGIALEPDNHVLFSNRSAAYCKLEEFGKALDDANQCVKINPQWGKVRASLFIHYDLFLLTRHLEIRERVGG